MKKLTNNTHPRVVLVEQSEESRKMLDVLIDVLENSDSFVLAPGVSDEELNETVLKSNDLLDEIDLSKTMVVSLLKSKRAVILMKI
jgi:DNA-binding MarR family transcriptional regulator